MNSFNFIHITFILFSGGNIQNSVPTRLHPEYAQQMANLVAAQTRVEARYGADMYTTPIVPGAIRPPPVPKYGSLPNTRGDQKGSDPYPKGQSKGTGKPGATPPRFDYNTGRVEGKGQKRKGEWSNWTAERWRGYYAP